MKNRLLSLTGLLLIIHFCAFAQTDTISRPLTTIVDTTSKAPASVLIEHRPLSTVPNGAYFKSFLYDARDIVIFPYRWNKYHWIAASGVVAVAAGLYILDPDIHKIVVNNQNSVLSNISTYGLEPWGSGLYTLPALGIMYGIGAIAKDNKARYTALKGAEAFLFAFLSAQILKQLTHRHRPYQDIPSNPYLWDGPFESFSNSSFPSGHSMITFAVAAVIATSYSKTIWVPIVCYTIAGLTAASRVYQNDHWFTDVFVGSALGFAIGRTVINNHLKNLKILPISHTGMGVMLVYHLK
jgi:membrane-associated phospholipid phosphatase